LRKKPGYGKGLSKPNEYWKELANQLLTMSPPHLIEESRMGHSGAGFQQTYKIVKISQVGMEWLQAPNKKPLMLLLSKVLEAFEDKEKWASQRKRDVLSENGSSENFRVSATGRGPQSQLALTTVHEGPHRVGGEGTGRGQQQGSGAKLPKTVGGDGRQLTMQEKQLLTVLTRVRKELSTKEMLPPATLCPDPLMHELVHERPSCVSNLDGINGASQAFMDKYGELFCKEIVKFCEFEFVELELDAGGWIDAASSCPSSANKRARPMSQSSGGGRVLPSWMGAAGEGIKRHKSSSQTNGHNTSEEKEGEGKRDNGREEGDYAGNSHQPQTMSMYKDLRTWRQARAKSEKQPAFCVFGNKVLDAIVAAAPTSLAALEEVPGMGPARCGKYGDEILEIISASCGAQSFTPLSIGKNPAEHALVHTKGTVVAAEHRQQQQQSGETVRKKGGNDDEVSDKMALFLASESEADRKQARLDNLFGTSTVYSPETPADSIAANADGHHNTQPTSLASSMAGSPAVVISKVTRVDDPVASFDLTCDSRKTGGGNGGASERGRGVGGGVHSVAEKKPDLLEAMDEAAQRPVCLY